MPYARSRLLPSVEDKHAIKKDSTDLEKGTSSLVSNLIVDDGNKLPQTEEEPLMISFETTETTVHTDIIRQPSPPPVLAEVQDLIPGVSHEHNNLTCGLDKPAPDNYVCSESPLQLHIVSLEVLCSWLLYCIVPFQFITSFIELEQSCFGIRDIFY